MNEFEGVPNGDDRLWQRAIILFPRDPRAGSRGHGTFQIRRGPDIAGLFSFGVGWAKDGTPAPIRFHNHFRHTLGRPTRIRRLTRVTPRIRHLNPPESELRAVPNDGWREGGTISLEPLNRDWSLPRQMTVNVHHTSPNVFWFGI